LRRLPEKVASAAVEFIYGALADNPHRVRRPLRFELEGRYSAHRGDYRVVYRIDERRRRVDILAIDHRADIYRRGWPEADSRIVVPSIKGSRFA
jgi:mRNA-degrading endonuclease RelE of RelBE toxin-antitoxin system